MKHPKPWVHSPPPFSTCTDGKDAAVMSQQRSWHWQSRTALQTVRDMQPQESCPGRPTLNTTCPDQTVVAQAQGHIQEQ